MGVPRIFKPRSEDRLLPRQTSALILSEFQSLPLWMLRRYGVTDVTRLSLLSWCLEGRDNPLCYREGDGALTTRPCKI